MTPRAVQPQLSRLALGARLFGLVVLAVPVVVAMDDTGFLALVALGVIWATATVLERRDVRPALVVALEAALAGTICGFAIDTSLAILGALAIPPFTSALRLGARGAALALSAQMVAVVILIGLTQDILTADELTATFTWLITGLGLGLIGSFLYSTTPEPVDALAPYRAAQALLRELLDISGGLSSGLDPESLAAEIAGAVRDELPLIALVVHVSHGDQISPLFAEGATTGYIDDLLEEVTAVAVHDSAPARRDRTFALPLATEHGLVAVVSGRLPDALDPVTIDLDSRLERLGADLGAHALRLDTALLFSTLRSAATNEERRRLAREIHDGVAQDIASLGYQVDALAARASSPQQAEALRLLRDRITDVVAEVRRSVQTLRSESGASASLGTAIGSIARHLSASSGIPIQVTSDERTGRLRPEVEAELFRIAQEAMTNAVRHAKPKLIKVRCVVQAPMAEVVVIDDGTGLGPQRSDSHGLEIMRERAGLIDADLTVEAGSPRGTVVTVRLPSTRVATPTHTPTDGKVSA